MIDGLARQRQTGGVRRGGGTVSGAWAGGRSPDGTSDRVCGAVRLLRRLADAGVSSAAKAETDFTAVQRAGAKCPVRCADVESVGAESLGHIMSFFSPFHVLFR